MLNFKKIFLVFILLGIFSAPRLSLANETASVDQNRLANKQAARGDGAAYAYFLSRALSAKKPDMAQDVYFWGLLCIHEAEQKNGGAPYPTEGRARLDLAVSQEIAAGSGDLYKNSAAFEKAAAAMRWQVCTQALKIHTPHLTYAQKSVANQKITEWENRARTLAIPTDVHHKAIRLEYQLLNAEVYDLSGVSRLYMDIKKMHPDFAAEQLQKYLSWSIYIDRVDAAEFFVQQGADPHAPGVNITTRKTEVVYSEVPLMQLAKQGWPNKAAVKYLSDLGVEGAGPTEKTTGCVYVSCRPEVKKIERKDIYSTPNKDMAKLLSLPSAHRQEVIGWILEDPAAASPVTWHFLSMALLQAYRDEEAVFWYLAAQLRLYQAEQSCKSVTTDYSLYHPNGAPSLLQTVVNEDRARFEKILDAVLGWNKTAVFDAELKWLNKQEGCLSEARMRAAIPDLDRAFVLWAKKNIGGEFSDYRTNGGLIADWRKKAQSGDKDALYGLALCYEHLFQCADSEQEIAEAVEVKKANLPGDQKNVHPQTLRQEVEREFAAESARMKQALAQSGYLQAQMDIASTQENREALVRAHFKKNPSAQAALKLAALLPSAQKSWVEAYAWFRLADRFGDPSAVSGVLYSLKYLNDEEYASAVRMADDIEREWGPVLAKNAGK